MCCVTQELLVGTRTERKSLSKNSFHWKIKWNSEKSQVGCGWELVFSVWLVKSALEMWKGKGEEACGRAQTHRAFPERVRGIKAFPRSAQTVTKQSISQCTQEVQQAEHLRRGQLQEENTEKGFTFKKIFLIFQPEDLWVLLHKGWMANDKLSHVPFSTGLLTVTGKEKKTLVHRGNTNPREGCDN